MITTVLLVALFLVILIVGHEFGHFILAKLFGMRVDEFGLGFPPKLWGKKFGETEYTVNAIPFGGFVKIYGEDSSLDETALSDPRSFRGAPIWKRAFVVVGGVVMNFFIAWLAFSAVFMVGIPNSVFIESVRPESPAAEIGLLFGDEIVGFQSADEFTAAIAAHEGQEMTFTIAREGEEITLTTTPRVNPPEGEGRLGVTVVDGGVEAMPVHTAFYEGMKAVGRMTVFIGGMLFSILGSAFGGEWAALEGVSGPVGIFNAVGSAGAMGLVYIFQLLGLISVNLAIINIFPFPALDGGRFVFLFFEPILGKARALKVESVINTAGFAVLISLMAFITVRDVLNLI